MKKKKGVYEEIIVPGAVLVALGVYLKGGSLSNSLAALFGLLFLYAFIEIGKQIMYSKKSLRSGIQKIDQMTGHQFEDYLLQLFKHQGYKVRLTKAIGDYGADLVLISSEGKVIAVQAKRYKNNVGIKAVQEVGTSLQHYHATEGWVVTNSYYTKAARTLAKSNGIQLYNRDDLIS